MDFFVIDAFANEMFGGNPAGVLILGENDSVTDEFCQKLAAEVRFSETAFVKQNKNEFDLRYFTPASEVDLCGHATIASFVALLDLGVVKNDNTYKCNTKAGDIFVSVKDNVVSMSMGEAKIIKTVSDIDEIKRVYDIMGVDFEINYNEKLPLEAVTTGLPDLLMSVKNFEQLQSIEPDFARLAKYSKEQELVGVHAFCIDDDGQVNVRNFAPLYDIDEEAATGTSNGALIYYLYDKKIAKENVMYTYLQGEKMGRKSQISAKLTKNVDKIDIFVGGTGVIVTKGKIK